MSALTKEIKASYAFVERDANLIKRYWSWEIVWLTYSLVNCLSMSYIGVGMQQIAGSPVPLDSAYLVLYLTIGTLVWRYLSTIFYWISDLIGIERWEGTIEYTLMAPIRRITHMAGQTLFAVTYGMISTALILAITAMLFNLDLARANLAGGALMLIAGSLSFIGVGIMASILPLLFPERGSQMTHVIIAVILLVSGVYYPVDVLPPFLRALAVVSPATYVLEGSRRALLEGAGVMDLWQYIAPLLVMGVIAIPLGLWVFGLAEKYAKRTGKLHRNG